LPISGRDIWHARVGDPSLGINAFAAPVFDHEGAVVLSVTAMGPERSFDAR
jgi:DNA-binding IclR family transcriptional regulator